MSPCCVQSQSFANMRMGQDPFTNLEHKGKLEQKAAQDKPVITALTGLSNDRWKDDYDVNKRLRRKFRVCYEHSHDILLNT